MFCQSVSENLASNTQ